MFVHSFSISIYNSLIVVVLFYLRLADQNGMMGSMMQDLAFAIPGVDEAMSFAEIMKYAWPS